MSDTGAATLMSYQWRRQDVLEVLTSVNHGLFPCPTNLIAYEPIYCPTFLSRFSLLSVALPVKLVVNIQTERRQPQRLRRLAVLSPLDWNAHT
jgi:hypothetical protein